MIPTERKGRPGLQLLIEQRELADALNIVGRIVPRRPITPIVSTVLITASDGRVRLRATDLQCFAEVTLTGRIHAEGAAAVDARFFQRIAATLDEGDVALSLSDSGASLRITAGHAAFRLRTVDSVDFPVQTAPQGSHLLIETDSLIDLISRTTFCAADSDDISPFAGVLIIGNEAELTLAATDSYQLAHYRLPARRAEAASTPPKGKSEAVVPTGGLTALTRALTNLGAETTELVWDARSVWFRSGAIAWQLRRLDLQYPDLSPFTGPLAGVRLEVGRQRLLEAVKQVASIADEGRAMGLRIDGNRLHVFTSHQEVGEAQTVVALGQTLPRREVWVDAQRLTRAISAQPEEEMAVYLSEPLAPIVLLPASKDASYRAVLTPLRQYIPEMEESAF